jgi:hypothetical protein
MSGDGKTRAAIAESLLKKVAQCAGPFIGGRVGISEMENVDRIVRFTAPQPQQLFKNRRERAGLPQIGNRRRRKFLIHSLHRRGAPRGSDWHRRSPRLPLAFLGRPRLFYGRRLIRRQAEKCADRTHGEYRKQRAHHYF